MTSLNKHDYRRKHFIAANKPGCPSFPHAPSGAQLSDKLSAHAPKVC